MRWEPCTDTFDELIANHTYNWSNAHILLLKHKRHKNNRKVGALAVAKVKVLLAGAEDGIVEIAMLNFVLASVLNGLVTPAESAVSIFIQPCNAALSFVVPSKQVPEPCRCLVDTECSSVQTRQPGTHQAHLST